MPRLFLFLVTIGLCTSEVPKFPNINYLAYGYDLLLGNPFSPSSSDPGFRQFVWDLTVYAGNTTPDGRYQVPKGVDAASCTACASIFIYLQTSGSKSYQASLQEKVSGDYSGWVQAFSGSAEFQYVIQETSNSYHQFTQSYAECCVYTAVLETFSGPPPSGNLISGVAQMPTVFTGNELWFWKFIAAFGTHALNQVKMGGRNGQLSEISAGSWSLMTSSNLDVSQSVEYSALFSTAAKSTMTSAQIQQAQAFQYYTVSQIPFWTGGEMPADGTTASWQESAKEDPMPLSYSLTSLVEVVRSNFPSDPNITAKVKALSDAYTAYCNYLLTQGQIKSCAAPPPDPPFPPQSIFGGIYTGDDCNKNNVPNPYTKGLNCMKNYLPYRVGRSQAPESRCGQTTFLCLLNGAATDPLGSFGGMWEHSDSSTNQQDSVVNPMTAQLNCPSYCHVLYLYARVLTNEPPNVGAAQYYCETGQIPLGQTPFAGFYQVSDNGAVNGNRNNYYTGALSCPIKYKPYIIARQRCPEDGYVGSNVYVCLNNVW